jgi:hypothetical protein
VVEVVVNRKALNLVRGSPAKSRHCANFSVNEEGGWWQLEALAISQRLQILAFVMEDHRSLQGYFINFRIH